MGILAFLFPSPWYVSYFSFLEVSVYFQYSQISPWYTLGWVFFLSFFFFYSSKHLMNFKCLEIMFFISIFNFFKKFSVDIFSPTVFFFLSYCSFTDSLIFLSFTAYFLSNFGPIFWERFLELYFPSLLLNSFLKLLWFLVSKVLSWCLFPTPSLLASWMG